MKVKRFLGLTAGIAAVAAAAIVAVSSVNANSSSEMSDLMMKNLEVLTKNESSDCWNGGPGATQCSIEAGTEILGVGVSAGCSVTCGDGYYACCSLRCVCKS